LFGVILKPVADDAVADMIDELKLFGIGSSWGGFESLCIRANPAKGRTATKWSPGGPLIRLHIGLEDTDDLIADLARAFSRLTPAA
jgi:cystathionine beta-lyase